MQRRGGCGCVVVEDMAGIPDGLIGWVREWAGKWTGGLIGG